METPNPGSKEAVEAGCTCAVIDNHYGKGALNGMFWINGDCPMHGKPLTPNKEELPLRNEGIN